MPKTPPSGETPVDIITHQPVLASSSTFQLTWPAGEQPHIPSLPQGSTLEYPQPQSQSQQAPSQFGPNVNPFFDNIPIDAVVPESDPVVDSPMTPGGGQSQPFTLYQDQDERSAPPKQPPPRFARAFSNPLPHQLKHLRHPSQRRKVQEVVAPNVSLPRPPVTYSDNFMELGLELADSVQMVIQTLIQISPPHLLDPAKEQLAGYTLQLPTPSVSALLTTMKNLNYMSANLSAFSSPGPLTPEPTDAADMAVVSSIRAVDLEKLAGDGQPVLSTDPTSVALDDFDVGEVLQSVGDVLSGMAAHAGVDLVLFHADVGMKHVNVRGDECGISYALCHVIRQVISTARKGDELEVGLYISAPHAPRLRRADSGASDATDGSPPSPSFSSMSTLTSDEPVMCTFEITHKFAQLRSQANPLTFETSEPDSRPAPQFNKHILQRLLAHVKATLQTDVVTRSAIVASSATSAGPSPILKSSRTVELSVMLTPGPPTESIADDLEVEGHGVVDTGAYQQHYGYGDDYKVATEPTLDDLAAFVALDARGGGLKGKKAVFHACERSSFAHHLTSYLTAWGMDVSHMPTDGEAPDGKNQDGQGKDDDEDRRVGGRRSSSASSRSRSRSGSRSGSATGDDDGPAPVIHPDSATFSHQLPNSESSRSRSASTSMNELTSEPLSTTPSTELPALSEFSFIIIDDNVKVLRRRLMQIRKHAERRLKAIYSHSSSQNTRSSPLGGKKRPSLAMHHRPKSSPAVRLMTNNMMPPISIPGVIEEVSGAAEASGHSGNTPPGVTGVAASGGAATGVAGVALESEFDPLQVVLVHFTSLSNYKTVQDTIQSTLYFSPHGSSDGYSTWSSPSGSPLTEIIPEVLVIPKPAGPRRFLTALHTAVRKPCVDPFFAPIATTPMSPGPRMGLHRFSSWAGEGYGNKRGSPSSIGNVIGSGGSNSRLGAGVRQNSSGSNVSGSGSISSLRSQGLNAPASIVSATDRRSPREHPVFAEQQVQQQHHAGIVPMSYGAHADRPPYAPYPPSPLATRENVEYFSPSAALPPTAPVVGDSAGVLLHSPDGRPSGILFQPQQQQGRRTLSNGSKDSFEQQQQNNGSRSGSFSIQSPLDALAVSAVGTPGTGPLSGRFRVSPAVETSPGTPGAQGSSYVSPTRPSPTFRRSTGTATGGGEDPGRPPMLRKVSNRPVVLPGGLPGSAVNSPRRRGSTAEVPRSPTQTPSSDLPYQGKLRTRRSVGAEGSANVRERKPGAVSRRSSAEAREKAALISPLKKGKASDGGIVPPINVLIVEDNPINQTIMSTYLKRKKILTQTAKNGQEAVDKWRVGNFHLILMDIQMPIKNGIDATKEIRAIEKERNIGIFPSTPPSETVNTFKAAGIPPTPYRSSVIIVALTASALQSDRVEALAAGCNDFLTKPISMDWLNSKIIEWGSIKVLEMFQDPAAARLLSSQNARSKIIASALKLPPGRNASPTILGPSPTSAQPQSRPSMPEPTSSEESTQGSVHTNILGRPTLTIQAPSTPDVTITATIENTRLRQPKQPVVEPIVETVSPCLSDKSPIFSPIEVSGATALEQHLAIAHKVDSDLMDTAFSTRNVLLGEGAMSSHNSSASIESVMHGVPPIAEDALGTTPEPDEPQQEKAPAVPMSPPSAAPNEEVPGPYP
ncbi:ssk1 response regulator receiver [Tulasnella sp. JGI-2019a]|nr:ssk1 response regulator receiver [Tulasnella sp. JGI-2019a]